MELAFKLQEVSLKVDGLTVGFAKMEVGVKELTDKFSTLALSDQRFTSLLDAVTATATRSDERWAAFERKREADLVLWTEWRKSVDDRASFYRGASWFAGAMLTVIFALMTTFGVYYIDQGNKERDAIIRRIRANEVQLMTKDPTYRPAQ